ncbi:MAG: hypothetical protein PVI99_01245 [Anaerolineales bacterium]|jgi:MinD-like ATPase involved in chromosome partitioning or flagellar assembly
MMTTIDIRTVYFADFDDAQLIHARLAEAGGKYGVNFMFSSLNMDMADKPQLDSVVNSDYQLVIVHQNVQGFTTEFVRRLANERGRSARVVAVWAVPVGDTFDASLHAGAVAYQLPYEASSFENLAQNIETLLSEAVVKFQSGQPAPAPLPALETRLQERPVDGGQSRISHRTITAWTSKGGEGKSEVTGGLAYILAMLGGRKTLLVDADMNRGYFGLIVNKEARSFAAHKNITALGNLFYQTGEFPKLSEFVYNYPNPFTGKKSRLDILFGTRSARQASEKAFHPENAAHFIQVLMDRTKSSESYEVVIFDIGTLIQHPIHIAVLKEVANILILTAPNPGSFVPTTRGIDDMLDLDIADLSKMKLVINTYSKETPLSQEEIREHFYFGNPRRTIPHIATLPAVDRNLMDRVLAFTMLTPEAWLTDKKAFDGLGELVRQYINLASVFSTNLSAHAAGLNVQVAELLGEKKAGIFARLKK